MSDPDEHLFIPPNWGSPVTISVDFKTDVFASRDGYETRSSLREFPRISVSYTALGGRRSDPGWRGAMAANLSKPVGFPDLSVRVPAEMTSGSTLSGDFDSEVWSTARGVFVEKAGSYFHALISSPEPTGLELDRVLSIPAGSTVRVYPEMVGRIAKDLSTRYLTSSAYEAQVVFEAHAAQDRVKALVDWQPAMWYRERPVALWAPNWADNVDESWSFPEVGVDTGYGQPWFAQRTRFPLRTGAHRVALKDTAAVDEMMSFFCYCRGRQASFYAPTWVDDFIFRTPLTEGQTILRVAGQSALHLFQFYDAFKSLAVRSGGQFFLTAIIDAYAFGDDTEIVLLEPVPAEFEGAVSASWLLRQRFSTDTLDVEYLTDSVAEADVKTVSLIDDFMGVTIGGMEVTIDNRFLTIGLARDIPDFEATEIDGYHITIGGDFLG